MYVCMYVCMYVHMYISMCVFMNNYYNYYTIMMISWLHKSKLHLYSEWCYIFQDTTHPTFNTHFSNCGLTNDNRSCPTLKMAATKKVNPKALVRAHTIDGENLLLPWAILTLFCSLVPKLKLKEWHGVCVWNMRILILSYHIIHIPSFP